ncbi:MAG TPA: hypothetical protein VN694_05105 [Caulobacteraceae bacterium]|nr:hypothetical protein [Caulobacteraceae bacterium]
MKKELILTLSAAAMAAAPSAFAQTASAPAAATAYAVATVQKACLPMLRGEAVKSAAQSAGFRLENGGWVMPIAGKDEIDLDPPDSVNPHVCTVTITAQPSDAAAMRSALGAWAAAQRPPLSADGVDQSAPGAQGWVTSTWTGRAAGGAESVVLTQPQSPAQSPAQATPAAATDQPAAGRVQSTLLVSLSPS